MIILKMFLAKQNASINVIIGYLLLILGKIIFN